MAVSTGVLALLLLAVAAVYWPGLGGGFAFDDYPNIVQNTALHVHELGWDVWLAAVLSSGAGDLRRPLAMLTFAVNHYFTGLNPWPMKLTNLGLHLLNAGLVFGLCGSLYRAALAESSDGFRRRTALFVTAWWALLPINFMAVLLIVQRMESLANAFVLAGLWLYVVGRLRQLARLPGWPPILAGLFLGTALGALSKESAVLLPLYALSVEVFVFRFRCADGTRQRGLAGLFIATVLVPAILGVAWLLPRATTPWAYSTRNFTLAERLLTEPRVLLDYLQWTIAPRLGQLSLFHDDYPVSTGLTRPIATLAGIAAVLALLALAWRARHRRPLTSLGLTWFLAAQALTATFIPLELVFEHRNYFASLGVCLVLADLLLVAPTRADPRRLGMVVAAALLIFYAGTTHLRALEWSDPVRFAQTEAAKHPRSPRATYQLAQVYAILSMGRKDSPFTAAAFAAFERAQAAPNAGIAPSQGVLLLAARTGVEAKPGWWTSMQARLAKRPIGPQDLGALAALTDCAVADLCHFPPEQMLRTFGAALSQGDNPEVLNMYGNYALNVLDDVELTERLWREAARLKPQEPQYAVSTAKLMIALGRYGEAGAEIQRLRSMGRWGEYRSAADALERRLADARNWHPEPREVH